MFSSFTAETLSGRNRSSTAIAKTPSIGMWTRQTQEPGVSYRNGTTDMPWSQLEKTPVIPH
jgi:hypothetical protein